MSVAEAFNVLHTLLIDWLRVGAEIDLERVDALLDGWDPEAEARAVRAVEGRLRAVIG